MGRADRAVSCAKYRDHWGIDRRDRHLRLVDQPRPSSCRANCAPLGHAHRHQAPHLHTYDDARNVANGYGDTYPNPHADADIHLDTTAHPYAMVDRHADTLPGDRNTHAYVHPCTTAHFHAHANACLHAHTSTTIHQDADGDSHAIAYSHAASHGVEHAQKTAFSDASQERAAYVYIQPVSDSHAIPHAHTVADAY